MSPRNALVLLALAALLAAIVFGLGEPEPDAGAAGGQHVFGEGAIDPAAVSSLGFVTRDGVRVRAERRQGLWWIVEPIEAPGDQELLGQWVETLASLRSATTLEEPQGPEVYGIVPESQQIEFVADGKQHRLEVGKKTPVGAHSYVREPASGRVFVVSTRDVDLFDKALRDLRDARVVRFLPSEIDRIELRAADAAPAVLVRGADGWEIVSPVLARADDRQVEALLSRLAFLRATEFVDRPGPEEEAGLARPEAVFRLLSGEAGPPEGRLEPLEVVLAPSFGGPTRLVRGHRGDAFLVAAEDVFELPTAVDDFRPKALSRFDPASVAFFEIVFRPASQGATTVGMERTETGWRAMTPEAMAAGTSSRLLAVLSELDAERIVAEEAGPQELAGLGLAPATVTFRVFGPPDAEGRPQPLAEVHLGSDEGARGILARRSDDPRVFAIASERRRELPIHYGAFVESFASKER